MLDLCLPCAWQCHVLQASQPPVWQLLQQRCRAAAGTQAEQQLAQQQRRTGAGGVSMQRFVRRAVQMMNLIPDVTVQVLMVIGGS
jgi:hypothetical protein